MKVVAFDATRELTRFGSRGATIGGVAVCSGGMRISILELAPGGVLGLHETTCPQLLLVIAGSARVCGGDETAELATGAGVLWEQGELHETVTDAGLTAIVVEADSIDLL